MLSSLKGYNDIVMINRLLLKSLAVLSVPLLRAAILFPVFGRARENARRSSCQSNLKQIGLGLLQYAQDYDGRLPPVKGTTFVAAKNSQTSSTGIYGWGDALQPYTKSVCILNCPSDFFGPGSSSGINPAKGGYTDYYMNALEQRQDWPRARRENRAFRRWHRRQARNSALRLKCAAR